MKYTSFRSLQCFAKFKVKVIHLKRINMIQNDANLNE